MNGYRFNSSFKIRLDAKPLRSKTAMRRSGIKRFSSLKRSAMKRSLRPMKKVGRRTRDWRGAWGFLKAEFDKRGRTGCEFKFIPHECWGPLDPAHSKKRRMMRGNDIYMVAIGCRYIHNFLDYECTHAHMELFVLHAIDLAGGPILPEGSKC